MRFLLRLFVAAILCFAAFYSDAMAQEQPNIIVIWQTIWDILTWVALAERSIPQHSTHSPKMAFDVPRCTARLDAAPHVRAC